MNHSRQHPLALKFTQISVAMSSFVIPFIWILSTDLIWLIGKELPGNVSDAAIAFPSGLPIVLAVLVAWLASFLVCTYCLTSKHVSALLANLIAVLTFTVLYTCEFGLGEWLFIHDDTTNLLPVRLLLAIIFAFSASLLVARHYSHHATPKPTH